MCCWEEKRGGKAVRNVPDTFSSSARPIVGNGFRKRRQRKRWLIGCCVEVRGRNLSASCPLNCPESDPRGINLAARRGPRLILHAQEDRGMARQTSSESLCESCAHRRVVITPRRSRFLLCQLAHSDAGYPKYPRQPVICCTGYMQKQQAEEDDRLGSR